MGPKAAGPFWGSDLKTGPTSATEGVAKRVVKRGHVASWRRPFHHPLCRVFEPCLSIRLLGQTGHVFFVDLTSAFRRDFPRGALRGTSGRHGPMSVLRHTLEKTGIVS